MPLAPLPPNWANNPNIPLNNALDEDWTCFRCNPPSNQPINPRIGSNFLRRLEETLNDQSVWNNTELLGHVPDCEATLYIEPVQESIRDKLLVISQGFLSRARDIHRAGADDSSFSRSRSSSTVAAANFAGFFILPPPVVLEVFLKMYACRVEPYLPFFPASAIGITQLIASNSNDEKSSILLLLLMIAHGAMGSPMPEALHLASGLIETCRICMYDVMEKHVRMAVHPVMLRCALMYLNAAAWSGNKWHMDVSCIVAHSWMQIVRYSRILDARKSSLANLEFSVQTEASWKTWQAEETINRLAYSWVFLDQEMNLIHDRQPELEIHDLNSPIPDNEELWRSISADVWQGTLNKLRQSRSYRADSTPPSLAALFNKFMGNDLSNSSTSLSPTELRLLLHPLQAMIYHLNKSMVYFFHSGSHRLLQRLLTQLEEVHYLLKQWYTLSIQAMDRMETSRNIYYSNMIMFHLISLTAITYFPDIERLARGEVASDKFGDSLWAGKRCIEEAPQIWCHCGQVIRYSRQMPASSRPFWWGAAIYRTALYMWATSLAQQTHGTSNTLSGMERINVDTLAFDHPSLVRYQLHQVDGVPVLSDEHGNDVSFAAPTDAITFCVNLVRINNGWGSQLDEGICARLLGLAERWKDG
ncbi:hypothetical protein CC78DRAFT_473255 [Lojkania enalia]|uniref:Xylanolytic transcriptional activator regulatory domain-containing protein n=1 Tax=Lojkania enalia TaxID=147567 RepID=A0A9P4N313_9PLEO|nr:hypothetical protein CC78DRAFT_473255 [Didymosphaeria enalia]